MTNLQEGGLKKLNSSYFDDSNAIIDVLSRVLTQLIDLNRNVTSHQHVITKFQSSYPPSISILAYLERINKHAKCSPNCFIIALIYIDRLIETRNVILSLLNVHRVLITSVMLATKVFDDEFYKNAYYAKLGGVTTQEMNSLELEFLQLMNFDFFVSVETFEKYQKELMEFVSSPSVGLSADNTNCSAVQHSQELVGAFNTPSPPVLMSCGQYVAQTLPTNHPQGQLLGAFGQVHNDMDTMSNEHYPVGGPGEDRMSNVVVPLTYGNQFGNDQFGSVTPPPLVAPVMNDVPQNPISVPHQQFISTHSQLGAQVPQQPVPYPSTGNTDMHQMSQQGAYGCQRGNGVPGYGAQSIMYNNGCGGGGGGCYVNPVTTPTSVVDQVFSWGGNGCGDNSGVKYTRGGHVAGQHLQQQVMMNMQQSSQFYPTNYYHPASGGNQPLSSPFRNGPSEHFVTPPHPSLSYNPDANRHHGNVNLQQGYFYPPACNRQDFQEHNRPEFSSTSSFYHYNQPFKHGFVTAGGGFGTGVPAGVWSGRS